VIEKAILLAANAAHRIIRSNYLTPEGVRFYEQSLKLYRDLSQDLDFNILYSERGHFTLAHTDAAIRTSRWRAEVNKQLGVDSELIFPDEIHRLCPHLNISDKVRYPILGALYHPPGAIATMRSLSYAARQQWGVDILQQTSAGSGKTAGSPASRPIAARSIAARRCRRSRARAR
jgi:sarcosine oxidase subunit beta